jgi:hypothetical protein
VRRGEFLSRLAEAMPEKDYSFKPRPEHSPPFAASARGEQVASAQFAFLLRPSGPCQGRALIFCGFTYEGNRL